MNAPEPNLTEVNPIPFELGSTFPFITPQDIADAAKKWSFEPEERDSDGRPKPFRLGRLYLHRADTPQWRSAVVFGTFEGKPAVLYLWSDLRVMNVHAQALFNELNRSTRIRAPQVYRLEAKNAHQGSMVMERITGYTVPFDHPKLSHEERRTFFGVFTEFLEMFSAINPEKLFIQPAERNPAPELIRTRVTAWTKIAETAGWLPREEPELYADLPEVLNRIVGVLADEPLVLMHNHLFPRQLWQTPDGAFIVTSFDAAYRPRVYEFTKHPWQIVLDWGYDWEKKESRMTPNEAIQECRAWESLALEQGIEPSRFAAGMLERCLGAFLADLGGTHRDEPVRKHELSLFKAIMEYYEPRATS